MEATRIGVTPAHSASEVAGIDRFGLASAIAIGIVGGLFIFVTPGFLALAAAQAGLDDRHLGYLAAWDLNTMAATIGLSSFLLPRLNWRRSAAVGLALIVLGNLASAWSHSYASLAAARVFAGAGEGIAVGFAFAALGRARNSDRAFAIYLVAGSVVSAVILLLLPFLQERFGSAALFGGNAARMFGLAR